MNEKQSIEHALFFYLVNRAYDDKKYRIKGGIKLKKFINTLQRKSGYISIEMVILSGLLVVLGAWAFSRFYDTSEVVIDFALEASSMPEHVTIGE